MMQLTSPAFESGTEIPTPNTCLGSDINPALAFVDVPINTQSLVLIVEDGDTKPIQTHWLVFNIPADTPGLLEGQLPEGAVEGLTSASTLGYQGPCPKYFQGIHHYYFYLYALDCTLDIPGESDKKAVKRAMQGHILEQAELLGTCTAPVVPTQEWNFS